MTSHHEYLLFTTRTHVWTGDWAISFDGFHAIPIHPDDRECFTFSIGGKVFQFAALPFGWTLSPFVFTKVIDAPSGAVISVPTMAWVCLRRQSVDYRECPGGGRRWRIQEM
jgi:hypothetical protein